MIKDKPEPYSKIKLASELEIRFQVGDITLLENHTGNFGTKQHRLIRRENKLWLRDAHGTCLNTSYKRDIRTLAGAHAGIQRITSKRLFTRISPTMKFCLVQIGLQINLFPVRSDRRLQSLMLTERILTARTISSSQWVKYWSTASSVGERSKPIVWVACGSYLKLFSVTVETKIMSLLTFSSLYNNPTLETIWNLSGSNFETRFKPRWATQKQCYFSFE